MKKLIVVWLMLVYGFSLNGMTVHLHYCCGKLEKAGLSDKNEKKCSRHAKPMKGCCHDKKIELKVKADHKAAEACKIQWKAPLLLHSYTDFAVTQPQYGKKLIPSLFAQPPPLQFCSLYTLYCVYRI